MNNKLSDADIETVISIASGYINKEHTIKEYLEEDDWVEEDILKILSQIRHKMHSGNKLVMV